MPMFAFDWLSSNAIVPTSRLHLLLVGKDDRTITVDDYLMLLQGTDGNREVLVALYQKQN